MRTRREQHQAFRFLNRRIVSALLSGEPETNELPMRRFGLAVFGSAMVAILVFVGFGVYGLLFPGGRRPDENVIIVERETGAKFLYLQGLLHPVLNWTSARLIVNQPTPTVRTMAQQSLRDVPRGRSVGIPNAPDTLPAASALTGMPWSVCSAPRSPASVALATQVLVGRVPTGGSAVRVGEGLLVSTNSGARRYLIWHDHRLRVPDNATLAALNWASIRPAPVGEAFLNAIPAGPDLTPIAVPGAGSAAASLVAGAPTTVGQMFRVATQNYVMLREGLATVGELAARLGSAAGQPVTAISAQEAGRLLVSTKIEPSGLPTDIPGARGADDRFAMACAVYRGVADIRQPVSVETFASVGADMVLADQASVARAGTDGVLTSDRVLVPDGHGAVVSTLTASGATASGNVYLITDQGIKYPLPRANAEQIQASLGYANVRPVPVPGSILALIPTGVALDPQAAAQFAPVTVVNIPGPASPSS